MQEEQHTTFDGNRISGEFVIKLDSVTIDDFLKYRAKIRELTGFGGIAPAYTHINEQALIRENQLDRQPETYKDAMLPPVPPGSAGDMVAPRPAARMAGAPKHEKQPKMHPKSREFLKSLVGKDQPSIVMFYRARFKMSVLTDSEILKNYQIANGLI